MENAKTRIIDDLWRIVLPSELREELGWDARDVIELYRENDTIVMRKTGTSGE